MLEQRTQLLLHRLREQSNLAYGQNTLSGLFYVMYGFVEIIENDPIFFRFIKEKIDEENKIHKSINDAYHNKEIDNKLWYELSRLHVADKFWHEYYCLFKDAHDSIKKDRCCALGIKADKLMTPGLVELDASDPRWLKRLTKDEAEFYTGDFEKCLDKITELINSDQKLLNQIYNEFKKENPENLETPLSEEEKSAFEKAENTPRYRYNHPTKIGIITLKDETLKFEGRRALILDYFFKTRPILITYHDFNEWLKLEKIKDSKVTSVNFRQDMEGICERIKNESKYLKSIITKTGKHRKLLTEINIYKFEILYK
ncbi:MAG: hypothetical protein WC249_02410 [Patescibacteria group bacterium]|jgi:hypothetical protein